MDIHNDFQLNFEYIHYFYPVHPIYPCSFKFSIFYHKKPKVHEELKVSSETILEKKYDGKDYYACSPTLPGCYSNGPTIEIMRKKFGKQSNFIGKQSNFIRIPLETVQRDPTGKRLIYRRNLNWISFMSSKIPVITTKKLVQAWLLFISKQLKDIF
ncbi:MAG: hypothetical protein QY310_05970 [Candidatus Jettenia sp. CY-1]|nr:MAG: hypothetical protein QY310_05970 [Candidatus Jettenia sp. CY-1]